MKRFNVADPDKLIFISVADSRRDNASVSGRLGDPLEIIVIHTAHGLRWIYSLMSDFPPAIESYAECDEMFLTSSLTNPY